MGHETGIVETVLIDFDIKAFLNDVGRLINDIDSIDFVSTFFLNAVIDEVQRQRTGFHPRKLFSGHPFDDL